MNREAEMAAQLEQQRLREEQLDPNYNIWNNKEILDMLKHYTDDTNIDSELRKDNWAVFSKAFLYSFLESNDMIMVELQNNLLRLDYLMRNPMHRLTFEKINELDQIQVHSFFTAKRAIGTKQQVTNERTLQNTQIVQRLSTSSSAFNLPRKRGGIKGSLGRLFG